MADYVALLHLRDNAVENVEVRSADRTRRDFDDGVAWILYFGIGDGFVPHVAFAVPAERFHGIS
jgi:hypothetical protein